MTGRDGRTQAAAVLLVRHASAKARHSWAGDDASRPLDGRGHRQAVALIEQLAPFGAGRVLSSRAVRCIATVAPMATGHGLKVEDEADLFEGAGTRALALVRSLLEPAGGTTRPGATVLCSHGDVIPEVLAALEREGVSLGEDPRCQKGSTWVLGRAGDGAVTARYLLPPA